MIAGLFVGLGLGFAIATAGYELLVLAKIRRDHQRAKTALNGLRLFAPSKPVRSDLSDSSPSLPL